MSQYHYTDYSCHLLVYPVKQCFSFALLLSVILSV